MKKIIIILLLLWCSLGYNMNSFALEVSVSRNKILKNADFQDRKIYVSGKKDRSGELIIILKSNKMNYKIYSKERTFGIWKNSNTHIFHNIYGVYLLQTEKMKEIPAYGVFREFEIGALNIYLDSHSASIDIMKDVEYRKAFLDYKTENSSYIEEYEKIKSLQNGKFATAIELPQDIKAGEYLLEIFLFEEEVMKEVKLIKINIEHAKSMQTIRQLAKENKISYAFISILVSIILALLSFGVARVLYYNRVSSK